MTKRNFGQGLLNLLPILLFAVLAASVLSVLLSGSRIYAQMTAQNRTSYVSRTVEQYLCTKVRQAEQPSDISVEEFGGSSALVIRQELDGQLFTEYIYCHEGQLKELFSFADSEMSPEDGEALLEISAFSAELADGLLTLSIIDTDGTPQTVYLDLSEEVSHEA